MEEIGLKKKRVMILFIESAEKILREEGTSAVSIRRVAAAAGYNSATLYNYFHDLEHLLLFASVRYLKDYLEMLGRQEHSDMTALERYRTVYHCFNHFAFREPEVFHNIFYGRHSGSLEKVLQVYYYQLFPAELVGLSERMCQMLTQGTMRQRDQIIMKDMVKEGFIAPEKAERTLEVLIAVHQSYIYDAMILHKEQGESFDVEQHMEKFNQLFEYIFEMGQP